MGKIYILFLGGREGEPTQEKKNLFFLRKYRIWDTEMDL